MTSGKSVPQAKRLPSSTYIDRPVLVQERARWRMGEAKMIERTGEIGEPWGVPTWRSYCSEVKLLNLSATWRLVRKDWSHFTISRGKPRALKTATSR